jgi:nucleoside 2-deoxyribosyltransferase
MVGSDITCPICKLTNQRKINALEPLKSMIECERCGRFITRTVFLEMESKKNDTKNHSIIAWIRDLYEQGSDPPEIQFNSDFFEQIENNLPNYTPTQKILVLLRNIARKTRFPGDDMTITPDRDYPLAWAKNEEELIYYLNSLVERKFIRTTQGHLEIHKLINVVKITAAGWEFLEKNYKVAVISNQAFVAMSFSDELNSVWSNAIKKGIEDAGYSPYRIDKEPHSDRIDMKIMNEIKNSRFLIADVTNQRQGVYFEAGYALGLGLPVIWSCRKEDFKHVHFDTRQYNHIIWETSEQLKEQLYNFICVVVGKISKQ